jgi:hypothetical protein
LARRELAGAVPVEPGSGALLGVFLVDRLACLVQFQDVSEDGEASFHLARRILQLVPVVDAFQHRVTKRSSREPPGKPADRPGHAVADLGSHETTLKMAVRSWRLDNAPEAHSRCPSPIAATAGDSRPGSVGSGRRPSPQATRSALDGFRATPDNREAGDEPPEQSACSIELARPCARGLKPERGGAALIISTDYFGNAALSARVASADAALFPGPANTVAWLDGWHSAQAPSAGGCAGWQG